ncbi:hypothetical protein C922_05447 [Plasmodium inui San Antonio 1]|uniref:Uncharacterized protein n=1 Tax=Plasmodium inui San Antonio 1 TaxID=1237626 RepID=W7AFU0_9APIC|nr:hypothetical protein C922_05447 [Plasmodium inui San Antonio 1]EUD64166.1 hypothetical protein C922_05447 [Plasmodium inui San Antonio 1]
MRILYSIQFICKYCSYGTVLTSVERHMKNRDEYNYYRRQRITTVTVINYGIPYDMSYDV